jgi:hypothetical protein
MTREEFLAQSEQNGEMDKHHGFCVGFFMCTRGLEG